MSEHTTFDGSTGERIDKACAQWMRLSARVPVVIALGPTPRTTQLINRLDKILSIGERLSRAS